jgi:hypothetical protein
MGVSYKRRAPAAGMKKTATLSFSLSKYTHDALAFLHTCFLFPTKQA